MSSEYQRKQETLGLFRHHVPGGSVIYVQGVPFMVPSEGMYVWGQRGNGIEAGLKMLEPQEAPEPTPKDRASELLSAAAGLYEALGGEPYYQ